MSLSGVTDARAAAHRLLGHCLRGEPWPPQLLDRLLEPDAAPALFGIVIERLCDLFEPRLCDAYAGLFSIALERTLPELRGAGLRARYERIRKSRPLERRTVREVIVLSRVTLGADIAVTGIVLDAALRRFPEARIRFAGARKNFELFAGEPRIEHLDVPYLRSGTLAERLASWPRLCESLAVPDSIVIDPDSRLTQLGLLPVCRDEDYYFFESRSPGGGMDSLRELTRQWVRQVLGVDGRPWIRPCAQPLAEGLVTLSLGVGGNPEKRLDAGFERGLFELAAEHGEVLADLGVDPEEAGRVRTAAAGLGVRAWQGDFATFAATIARSRLYLGYDSSGQHVASACGVPFVTVFAGAVSERFLARWSPPGGTIVPVREQDPERILARVRAAVSEVLKCGTMSGDHGY